jgi:forkhead box protein J2/3
MDESGNVNWRLQWMKELEHLQQLTEEQDKDGASEEWYRVMFIRVRTALMQDTTIPPHLLPPQVNPVDQQQPQ